MNPAEFLTISSAVVPEREALVSGDGKLRITYEQMAARVPVGRLGGVEEVAAIVVAVAANAYVTGETVQVNGGLYFS